MRYERPATSAHVERVFSQSGLIMKPNRARMSDNLLEELACLVLEVGV